MTITLEYSKLRRLHPHLRNENEKVDRIFLNFSRLNTIIEEADKEIIKEIVTLFPNAEITIFGVHSDLKDKVEELIRCYPKVRMYDTLIDYDQRDCKE